MNINISKDAANWYLEEMGLKEGDFVRFFVRYGGCSTVQRGFSLGVTSEEPIDIAVKTEELGITFYIEEKDLWYFDSHDLNIEYQSEYNEPVFQYNKKD